MATLLGLALGIVISGIAAAPARAQDGADTGSGADAGTGADTGTGASDAESQALLVEAVREYEASNYEEAYALFLRVHALRPTARTERALGKTAFGLRRYREAVRWLSSSLDDTRSPLTPEMRTDVESFLLRARSFLGHFTVRVVPEAASVDVDGSPLDGGEIDLEIGDHEILVRASGHEASTRRVSVRGGENETIEITLLAAPTATTLVMGPRPDPGGTQRDLGWAGLIAGGVLVAGGAVATILWSDAVASLNANIDRGSCTVDASESLISGDPACYAQQSRYRIALPLQYVGYATGALLLGVGIALIASAPSGTEEARAVSCMPGLGSLSCRMTF